MHSPNPNLQVHSPSPNLQVHSVDYEAKILLTTPRHGIGTRRVCNTGLEPRTCRPQAGLVLCTHYFEPRLGQALSDWHPEERLIFFDEMLVA